MRTEIKPRTSIGTRTTRSVKFVERVTYDQSTFRFSWSVVYDNVCSVITKIWSHSVLKPRSRVVLGEANSHSASQEISCHSASQEIHYRVYKGPPLDPTLSQIHPVHNLLPYFPKIHSNIIFLPTPRSSKRCNPLKNFVWIFPLSHACYMPRPSHPHITDHSNDNFHK